MTVRRKRTARSTRPLVPAEVVELVLGGTWDPAHTRFASDEDRRVVWHRHRDRLLAQQWPGHRPHAWWAYEAGEDRPHRRHGPFAQAVRLAELGELTDDEVAYFAGHRDPRARMVLDALEDR